MRPYLPDPASRGPPPPARAGRWRRFLGRPGLIVALAGFWLCALWAGVIQPLDAPDEPAHLQAIMQVRKQHILPEIHYAPGSAAGEGAGAPGDPAVRAYALQVGNPYSLVPYESTQPPLYYLVAGIVALPFPPDPPIVLYLGRLVAALFGAGAVFMCWKAARELAPGAPQWALAAAGAVALLPAFCFNSATASNDSAASFAGAAAFYVWFRGLRHPPYDPWLLKAGAMLGLAVLAKLTAAALIPGLGLLLLFRACAPLPPGTALPAGAARRGRWLRRGPLPALGAAAGALAVCGPWLVRNILVYGDFTGTQDSIRYYTGKFTLLNLADAQSRALFAQYSWESTWGRFGWLDIPLPPDFYRQAQYVTGALVGLSGLALLAAVWRWVRWRRLPVYAVQATLIMLATAATLLGGYLQYSLTVGFEAQARYFFLALLPAALVFTGGLYALAPGRVLKTLALSLPLLWLAVLNAVGLLLLVALHR